MSRWKRTLIVAATFAAGLVYVLAFLLPEEIGGGIDRHGMYAPWLVGNRLFYTTGVRATSNPLIEHDAGSQIVMLDLDRASVRKTCFNSSIVRSDDFRGAKRPVVFQLGGTYRMLYIGIGKDDRRRICMAESSDGTNWNPLPQAVFETPADANSGGPQWFTVFQSGPEFTLLYSQVDHNRRVLRSAVSLDLIRWHDRGLFAALPEPRSILSAAQDAGGKQFFLIADADGVNRIYAGKAAEGRIQLEQTAQLHSVVARAVPGFSELVDLAITNLPNRTLFLLAGGTPPPAGDGRLRISILETQDNITFTPIRNSQPDGSILALGGPAFSTGFDPLSSSLSEIIPVIVAFGFALGLINVVRLHGSKLKERGASFYSVVTLVSAAAMFIAEWAFRQTDGKSPFWAKCEDFLFMNLLFPLGGTVFGLLSAYLISAAYRAFRIRNWEAAVLTIVAAAVLITQVPTLQIFGAALSPAAQQKGAALDSSLHDVRTWILLVPNDAVQRAIGFGVFIGALAMAIRTWLSLDRLSARQ